MTLVELKQQLPLKKALLGIDYGSKRLGLAVSDLSLMIASSYQILYRRVDDVDLAALEKVIAEKEIGGIIYGLPLQMDGTEGKTSAEVRAFADKVFQKTRLPYAFWDERLSSAAVENFLIQEVDLSRAKRKKVLDANAAAYILQGALDALKNL